uniref:Ribonuclease H-like domain-containing protein n=1 Tax=Tanacetum cinerariifolium TaxID=118510 RepID=A0A6L2MM39_TANCI|nr:ribonuclease H-like domain-containing protein [Tanacetum cinerariifolium]
MQTQTSNTLHNAIMEAGGKDRLPMLAPGSSVTTTETYMENYKNVLQDIRDQLSAEAEAVQIILIGIEHDIYSTVDACPNASRCNQSLSECSVLTSTTTRMAKHQNEVNELRAERIARAAKPLALVAQQQPVYHPQNHPTHYTQNSSTRSQQAATRNRGKAIINSPTPIYDQELSMVAKDDKLSKDKETDKLMALISLSGVGYDNQRLGNVARARETVARECQKPKRAKDAAYHMEKMLLCKQEEAEIQLNAEQADWRDDTDDESEDQELKAHYMYMAQIQEVTPDAADSKPIFDFEPLQKVSNDDHYNVFAIESDHPEQSEFVHDTYLIEQDEHNVIIDSLDMSYGREQINQNDDDDDLANKCELLASLIEKLKCEIDDSKNHNKFLETSNKVLVEKLKGDIKDFKNKNKSLKSSNNRFKEANNKLSKINALMYNDLKKFKAELDRRNDVEYASKVKIDCAKAKGDLISYKMESQKSFNKYTQQMNDLNQKISEIKKKLSAHQKTISIPSQVKEAQIKLYKTREDKELDKLIALENKVKVLDNIVYKTGQSVQTMNMLNSKCQTSFAKPEFLKKAQRANPRLYDIGVIPTTSVRRPQLKSNPLEDRLMLNNSQGKKQEVEDQRRNVKLSKNKTSVTACNDSLNAKTLNVNFVCATCVLENPNALLNNLWQNPLRKTVASETTNQKPRNITGKLYERVKIVLFIIDSGCSKHMTGNLKLLINFVEKFMGMVKFRNDQIAHILGYGDLVQGAVTIKWVYYVEGLNHNLFFVDQFCDADLEVAFRKSTCYIRDLKGNDLLTACKKNTDSLNSQITELSEKLGDTKNMLYHYKLVLSPLPAQVYSPPKKDMSWTGLLEFADDTITNYTRPSPSVESNPDDLQNNSSSAFENKESTCSILSKPEIKFVKPTDSPTVVKTDQKETVRKPTVKYAELYRKLQEGNSQNNINDKGYWDSGCSRHITGNISYLTDYEPYDGGPNKTFYPLYNPNNTVSMARLAFCDYHNMIAILEKYEHNIDFHQIVDFVEASNLMYALTINPTIYVSHIRQFWSTARIETTNEGTKILATVDGTPTEPHHTPTLESTPSPQHELSLSSLLPSITEPILTVIPTDNPLLGNTPKELGLLKAEQDRANIIKTSTFPSDLTPRVTSLAADERNMQHKLTKLTDLCTRLQRQQEKMASKITAQDLEIASLKARIQMLEDKDREGAEPSGEDATIKERRLETGEEACIERSTKKDSNDTEDMANILTSLDAASVLASVVQVGVPPAAEVATVSIPSAGKIPTISVPTGSGMVPTASLIYTTATESTPYTRRKGKEKMVESDTPKKKKLQEYIDIQVAREMEEHKVREDQRRNEQIERDAEIARIHAEEELQMMIDGLDRKNEIVVKYLQEYEKFYQIQQRKPLSRKQEGNFYMSVLRSHAGWKAKYFKGMPLKEIKEKFDPVWKQIHDFVPMGSKEESERFKRKGLRLEQESVKKVKTSEEVLEEDLKEMMQLVPVEELWALVKETLSIKPAISDKEKELWVELKRLYEPDVEDQLWTHTQTLMHAPRRIVGNKMLKAFPLPVMSSHCQKNFPLLVKKVPLLKKRDATADKDCTANKDMEDPILRNNNLLSKNDIVVGLPKLKFIKDHLCSSCELGKAKRKSFQSKTTPSLKRWLQLLHMDLCGPMRVASINRKRYVLVIVDDYSRYTWTYFLKSKDETPEVLIDFLRLVQRGLDAQVRIVRTDKGTEFLNKTLHAYFASEGILHQTSIARTPKQNGIVERRNHTLVEAARTMLSAYVTRFDKSKVECFNCHKMGHFTREYRAPRNQERGKRDAYKQGSKAEEQTPKALMAIDGVDCKKNNDSLNSKITDLTDELFDANNMIYHYKLALAQVESILVEYKEREVKYIEKIRTIEFYDEGKVEYIETLKKELETLKQENEVRSDKSKEGLGYTAVPSPVAQLYLSPKKDLSWTGLSECADETVTDYSRPTPTASDSQSKSKTGEKETPEKPPIKNAELYRKSNKKPNVRGNQMNWNNLKSHQLGPDFVMKKKACFSCGNFNHLAYECRKRDSGCSRRMTGNISYLSDYEPFDGGYVSFGQGGCKITGKGTIKTSKLEFGNVYFVKDLRDFKLLDDANILLRTPRQHNMYSIDLNNIVPHRDLTCLVAKASADECNIWHRRLGHLNFKTMNKLVRHNLVRGLPTKCFENDHNCTACPKGKQHKASCTKVDASKDEKKDVSSFRYIVLPNWGYEEHLEFTSSQPQVYQMDVKSAFLYGTIDKEVYVMQPHGL